MIIDLIALGKTPYEFAFSLSPEEVELESETAKLQNAARISGELNRRIIQTDIEGEIVADIETECSRCLATAIERLKIPFKVSYITPENYTEEKEAEVNVDDLQVSVFDGARIDVSELVREQITLNLPDQSFCQTDCQGLCQQCGANRNLIDCKCIEKETDPRWAALKNLK